MDADLLARRFPLIARPRPTCPPLTKRIRQIGELARTARHDHALASAVQNQAALIASDCGLHEMARTLCWRHFETYLGSWPLDAPTARKALEPLVNLARLLIRSGDGTAAHRLLDNLSYAVRTRGDAVIDGRPLCFRGLTNAEGAHRTLCQWLWTVLLADGTRALTSAGRWQEALAYAEQHNGIGYRLLDGRQIAVLAHLHADNPTTALTLLRESAAAEPWEHAVTACLTALCLIQTDQPADSAVTTMVNHYRNLPNEPELTVFQTRLALTALDLAETTGQHSDAEWTATRLLHQILTFKDGYAAREALNHQMCRARLTTTQRHRLSTIVSSAGLDHNGIAQHMIDDLLTAATTAQNAIM